MPFGADASPTLRNADRVLDFMESFDRASMGVNRGSRPGHVEAHGEAAAARRAMGQSVGGRADGASMRPGGAARALVAHASVHVAGRDPLRTRRLQPDGLLSHLTPG